MAAGFINLPHITVLPRSDLYARDAIVEIINGLWQDMHTVHERMTDDEGGTVVVDPSIGDMFLEALTAQLLSVKTFMRLAELSFIQASSIGVRKRMNAYERLVDELDGTNYRSAGLPKSDEALLRASVPEPHKSAVSAVGGAQSYIAELESKLPDAAVAGMDEMAGLVSDNTDGLVQPRDKRMLPKQHDLKILPEFFDPVAFGDKTFEIREADRAYQVNDTLLLREWTGESYTGREIGARVIYLLNDVRFVPAGFVAMGISTYFVKGHKFSKRLKDSGPIEAVLKGDHKSESLRKKAQDLAKAEIERRLKEDEDELRQHMVKSMTDEQLQIFFAEMAEEVHRREFMKFAPSHDEDVAVGGTD